MKNTLMGLVDLLNRECCPKLFLSYDSDAMRKEDMKYIYMVVSVWERNMERDLTQEHRRVSETP